MKYTILLRFIIQAGLLLPVAALAANVEVTLKDGLDGSELQGMVSTTCRSRQLPLAIFADLVTWLPGKIYGNSCSDG